MPDWIAGTIFIIFFAIIIVPGVVAWGMMVYEVFNDVLKGGE